MATGELSYLGQDQAQLVDEELMGPLGFSVDQLMELAGLSVAQSILAEYPPASNKRILIFAGPGNNGGDGLVAARHLYHFGYNVKVCYPKQTDKPLYKGLVTQLKSLDIQFLEAEVALGKPLKDSFDVVVDAIFGFSFKGSPRPPFDTILDSLKPEKKPPKLVAVDSPSGWDIEEGDKDGRGLRPSLLVSLTAPKKGTKDFQGTHYLGGRFVPPTIKEKYKLQLPGYPGGAQCVKLEQSKGRDKVDPSSLRLNYDVAEKRGGLTEEQMDPDPLKQFDKWFTEAVEADTSEEANKMAIATADEQGRPSVRMVLLKGYDNRGFVFYTNFGSRKGEQLQKNAHASFCMYWEALQRQVRVEGSVEKVPDAEADNYFHSRPRGSQIGALVSPQSQVMKGGRAEIEERLAKLTEEFKDESKEIPRPQNWGGFLIRPHLIEFWQGRPSRLHDRIQFKMSQGESTWKMERLAP